MRVSVVQISNSKGIRLSKTKLEKYHITYMVELVLEKDHILLKAIVEPRKNWELAFENAPKWG